MAERGTPEMGCEAPANQDGPLKFGTSYLKYQMEQFIKSCGKPVNILLSGKTGVGKSHLTNALIGEELAEEGKDVDPQTDEVTAYDFIKNNVSITVFDTPGLADTTSNDDEYLRKIKEKESDFDLFLFCTEMNNIRFRNDDFETMKKLTQMLGVQLWDHAVVALTFANMVLPSPSEKAKGVNEKDAFNNHFRCLKKRIQQALIEIGVPEDVAVNVPFVPTGDLCEPRLPDRDNWLTAFWVAAFNRINRSAKAAFLLSNADRISFSCPVLDADVENQESMAIRALENTFQGVASKKDLVSSLPNPRPSVAAGKSSSRPPQNQVVTRTTSSIQLDESCSRNIINDMVGDVTDNSRDESKWPVFVRFYQTFLRWIIASLRKFIQSYPGKKSSMNDDQSGGKK